MEQSSTKRSSRDLLIPVLALFATGNALMAPVAASGDGKVLAVLWCGALAAQVALISAWIALWPAPLTWRVVVGAATGLFLFGSWILGFVLAYFGGLNGGPGDFLFIVANCLLVLPLFSLAAQAPLWFLRIVLRWRIARPGAESDSYVELPLAIRDILAATAAIAVVIGLARLARLLPYEPESTMVIELLIAAIAVAITSAATTLPLTIAILRCRDPADAYGVVHLIYGVLAVLGVGILSAMLGPTSSPDILSLSLGAIGLFLGTQATVLLAARIHGVHFTLANHQEQESAAQNA